MSERVAVRSMKSTAFLLALAVLALLIVVNILTLQARTKSQKSAAAVVNVSGRQRMLSQRMALLAQNLLRAETSSERADIRNELVGAIALFERSHRGLTEGDPEMGLPGDLPPGVRAIYFEPPAMLDEQVQRYLTSLKLLTETPDAQITSDDPSLQIIWATATQKTLLEGLDSAVAAFQNDSEAEVASLERRIWWAFGGALLTMAIAFWLAFLIVSRTKALEKAHRAGLQMLEDVEKARQKAEQAEWDVRGREAELRAILSTAVDGIITINERGIVESSNVAAEQLFGYTTGELIGQNVNVLMPPPHCDEHDAYIRRHLKTGKKKIIDTRVDVIGKRKDGTTFPLELAVSCVQLHDRRLFTGITRDLTERVRAAETLRESEERFRSLVELSQDGIMMVDAAGAIVIVNAEAERMFGYAHEELVGQPIEILVPVQNRQSHPQKRVAFLKEQLGRSQGSRFEFHGRRKDGSEFPIELGLKPIELADGTFVIITVSDFTERIRLQREFALAREIQVALLPKEPPSIPGFDIAGMCRQAESTGGDFYDFIRVDDLHLGIVIGDVSGHGFGPAILAAGAHSYLRAAAKTQPVLSAMIEATNQLLCEDTDDNRFITLALVVMDLQKRTLSYVSAGHGDALVFDGAGALKQRLHSTAIPLGILPDQEFPVGPSSRLECGDILLVLTDGFQETISGAMEQFGVDRIVDCVQSNREKSGRKILDELYRAVADFRGESPQQDDLTGVVVKVL